MSKQKKETAFILSGGMLHEMEAKTSHGLIRGSDRFEIKAIIDSNHAGKDAGEVLDGKHRSIPIFANIQNAIQEKGKPDCCIIGVSTIGGVLPPSFKTIIKESLQQGISIVNGLHEYLQDNPEFVQLSITNNAQLIDIRKPKAIADLHFWTGAIHQVTTPIIAVIGLDCAVGKRTTARFIKELCQKHGKKAEVIFTGQTGWMQGGRYGFIFDSTLNDFVSGELEHAIVEAHNNEQPDFILLEGQSALRNPSGPCGSEFLLSGNAKQVVLVVPIKRTHFEDKKEWGALPSIADEMKLIEMYQSKVIAISLNTLNCNLEEAKIAQQKYQAEFGIPVLLPLEEGMEELMPVLEGLV